MTTFGRKPASPYGWEMALAWCPPQDSALLGGAPTEREGPASPDGPGRRAGRSGPSTELVSKAEARAVGRRLAILWQRREQLGGDEGRSTLATINQPETELSANQHESPV